MAKIDEAIVLKQFQVNELSDLPKLRIIMEAQHIKPNFSLLSRELKVDRRTVKKYYNGFTKPKTKARKSKIDSLRPLIQELLSDNTLQTFYYKANLWRYLVENHNLTISESNFKNTFPIIKNFNNILINIIQFLNNLLYYDSKQNQENNFKLIGKKIFALQHLMKKFIL